MSAQVNQGRPITPRLSRRQVIALLRSPQGLPRGTQIYPLTQAHWLYGHVYGYARQAMLHPPPAEALIVTGTAAYVPWENPEEQEPCRYFPLWRARSVDMVLPEAGNRLWSVTARDLLSDGLDIAVHLPPGPLDRWLIGSHPSG